MAYTAQKVIDIALLEVGYIEKADGTGLDSKTENPGYNNWTKYARDLFSAGFYNGNKQGVPYCDVFHDWCHYQAAGCDKALAETVICQSGPYGAGCGYSMNYYKQAGRFFTADPQPGDQIFFGSGSTVAHTGIVVKVENATLYTVEGNTSPDAGVVANGGGVYRKSYALTDSRILGYGRPNYESAPAQEAKKEGVFTVNIRVMKNGSKGQDVRALQLLLIGNGCTCGVWGADGNFGAATEAAVRSYQTSNRLQVDGKAGPETWGSLLGTL